MPKILRRKKLRATTAARRSLRASAEMGYDDLSEPNMKLSRALLIVLVLHVVAVSGIIAFNAIKTRHGSFAAPPSSQTAAGPTVETAPPPVRAEKSVPVHNDSQSTTVPAKAIAKDDRKTDHAKPRNSSATVADSGKTYVVAKGDNPVSIAKKLKVNYDDLLALNHIDDPRKLQIGQKLLVPKTAKKKTTDND